MKDAGDVELDGGGESAARYRSLIENAFDVVVECAANGRILYVSPNVRDVLGYEPADIVGSFINELVHPDDVRSGIDSFAAAVMRGERLHATLRYKHKDGGWRSIEGRGNAYLNEAGLQRVVIIGRDITEHVAADAEQRRLLRRIRLQVDQTPVAIVVWDRELHITEWNPAAATLFGYARSEIVGRPHSVLLASGAVHVEAFFDGARRALASGPSPVRFTADNRRRDGVLISCEWLVSPLVDESGEVTGFLGIAQDVAERVVVRRLESLAYRDQVTGIANRLAFDERLAAQIEAARRASEALAVLYVDFDGFKAVNDRWGHEVGDRVLAALALRLKACLRETDLVARLGGDEFGIVLAQSSGEPSAECVAARVLDSLSRPVDVSGDAMLIRASIGIARYPAEGDDGATLLRSADGAMYRAKQKGGATFSY